MGFKSIKDMLSVEHSEKKPLWEVILEEDLKERGSVREDSISMMEKLWGEIKSSVYKYDGHLHSGSGMVGGAGMLMENFVDAGRHVSGDYTGWVITVALKMGESNACMKRIVAAPTAGSCGVLPAVLIPYYELFEQDEHKMVEALYIASGFGDVYAHRAFISGAEGGCQAEVGVASAMAAAALTYLRGGSAEQSADASAFAAKNLLGLACDPVAGLVEVPCVKRNVVGAMNAVSSAEMALAGIKSIIPHDEVIDALRQVGEIMPLSLRETGTGGLAATPEGRKVASRIDASKSFSSVD